MIVNGKPPEHPANFVLHTACGRHGFLFSLILIFHEVTSMQSWIQLKYGHQASVRKVCITVQ